MKIFQVITLCELGGAQTVVSNLSNELVKRGHEVVVIAGEGDGKMFSLLDKRIQVERIPSLVRRLSPSNEIKTIFSMRRLYRKYKPDIIHLHSSKAGMLGRIAFPSRKTLYTVHGFDSIRLAYRKFLPLEKLLQNFCSSIVGVSKYDKNNLLEEGITNNVSYVYNGIFSPVEISENPFKDFNNYSAKILCIARFSPQKNVSLFLQIAKKLPNYAFIWIGNQSTPNFAYPNNVHFLGNIPNAGAYTKYADLFLLTSNYEGLPMVIIESLSQGTPVIASAVGGITELLNEKNGLAVGNDPDEMAKKIELIISDNDLRNNMSKNAIQTFKSSFSVEQMADGYEAIYKKLKTKPN